MRLPLAIASATSYGKITGLAVSESYSWDMFYFLQDDKYINAAYHIAEAILPYAIPKPEGVAFPGTELLRISCDFALGSAGIGWFLHRLLNPELPRLAFEHSLFERRPAAVLATRSYGNVVAVP